MNTSAVAQNLASRGRGEDKMLVHMTPSEVEGLQALAMAQGGSLTINPETGLPEAGFLSDTFKALAPTIIGAGAMYLSGGTIQPWMIGLGTGAIETARTGDLGRGLMAGLGAYGGAGAVKGLAGMGAAQAGQVPTAAVDPKALSELGGGMVRNTGAAGGTNALGIAQGSVDTSLMGGNITGSASVPGTTGSYFNSNYGAATNVVDTAPVEMIKPATVTSAGTATNPFTGEVVGSPNLVTNLDGTVTNYANPYGVGITDKPITAESIAQTAAERTRLGLPEYKPSFRQNIDTGIPRLGEEGGLTAFKDSYVNAMGGPKLALLGGAGVLGSVADGYGAFDYKPMKLAEAETDDYGYEGPYLPAERNVRFRGRDAILGGEGREFKFFDPVNPVPNVRTAAHGGLMSAKKMAVGGRYLDGPGDGVSDSIPATVDGEQPVMLSEGEYIIPAEVVSAVGNGSSDAGAEKFTKLVDTIMAKTRRVAKGKPNGADKLLKGLIPQTA